MTAIDLRPALREIMTCPTEEGLDRIALKNLGENHPALHQYIAHRYLHDFSNHEAAKRHLIAGARPGLKHPCDFWDDHEVDSIGHCMAALALDYTTNSDDYCDIETRLHRLSFVFSTKYIERFGNRAPESFGRRALLLLAFGAKSFSLGQSHGQIIVVQILSDLHMSAAGWIQLGEPQAAQKQLVRAQYWHEWLEDISVAGRDADDYKLEEIALIGRLRNGQLFQALQLEYLQGSYDITTKDFDRFVAELRKDDDAKYTV